MELVHADFYQKYVETVHVNFLADLDSQQAVITGLIDSISEKNWMYRYAEGKWTVGQLLVHCIDTEQIMAFRALAIARGDKNLLSGFSENDYAEESLQSIVHKDIILPRFVHLRKSNLSLFSSMNDKLLSKEGIADGKPINVASLGYIIAGHWNHHLTILRDRYSIKQSI